MKSKKRDELFEKTLISLDWPVILERLVGYAGSMVGKERIRAVTFAQDLSRVLRLQGETSEVRQILDAGVQIPMGGIREIRPFLDSAGKGELLTGRELLDVANSLGACEQLRRFFLERSESCPILQSMVTRFNDLQDLERRLSQSFDTSGELSLAAYPGLAQLRSRIHGLHSQIESKLNGMLSSSQLSGLVQDQYVTMRADRYVIPLKVQARSMDVGIVHDASGSGQTVFVEPRPVIPLNNDLKLAEAEYRREERRILGDLTRQTALAAGQIRDNLRVAAEVELIHARARLSQDLAGTPPTLVEGRYLRLNQARHPVLVLRGLEVVPNDLSIGVGFQALILSGPNTGGKTVALKTLGLCALMTRIGLHIPAGAGSEVGLFKTVLTDIGDQQTVEQDLSTFSGHILGIRGILERVGTDGSDSLVLLDEIAVGTDPTQGAALARALLEAFVDRGAKVVVTTHYTELKSLSVEDPRFANGRVEYDAVGLRPTYRVVLGTPGRSYALDIALKLGLEPELVARARGYVAGGERALEDLLGELEQALTRARDERTVLERERAEAEGLRARYEARMEAAKKEAEAFRAKAMARFELEVRTARDEIADVVRAMQKGGERVITASSARKKISEVTRTLRERAPGSSREVMVETRPVDPARLKVGDRVMVLSLKREGTIQVLPESAGGLVSVSVGGMRVKIWTDDLRQPVTQAGPKSGFSQGKRKKQKKQKGRSTAEMVGAGAADEGPSRGPAGGTYTVPESCIQEGELEHAFQTSTNKVDLRGVRVDEGLDQVERFLDRASLEGERVVFVIHGHGTGAMKAAVRKYLKTSSYVSHFQPGARSQGGDGATVVALI